MKPHQYRWSSEYVAQTKRNIGFISKDEQEILSKCKVAMLGLGGIGGTCFEILVRSGIGNFSIVDKDIFEPSNLNRQIYAFLSTLGEKKVDVAERFALDINSSLNINKFEQLDEENIDAIFQDADVVVQAIDELKPCIISSRRARDLDIPLVESWALPYGVVRVIDSSTPSLEESYELSTNGRKLEDISDDELKNEGLKIFRSLGRLDGIADYYSNDINVRLEKGKIPSFSSIVWFNASLLALETLKLILGWERLAHGPGFSVYDPFYHRIPQNIDSKSKGSSNKDE